jgi:hypothetical protein
MANTYENLDQRPYESHYLYAETIIDHPVKKVWPYALNIRSWMSDHRLETVNGETGRVGHFERVFPHGLTAETPQPHYHLYGVAEVIPFKCIALEVFPEKGGSYGNAKERTSFDCILLVDLGEKTKLIFLAIDVNMVRGEQKDIDFQKREETGDADGHQRLNRYFENLKQLVRNENQLSNG